MQRIKNASGNIWTYYSSGCESGRSVLELSVFRIFARRKFRIIAIIRVIKFVLYLCHSIDHVRSYFSIRDQSCHIFSAGTHTHVPPAHRTCGGLLQASCAASPASGVRGENYFQSFLVLFLVGTNRKFLRSQSIF